jgi:hypothetical protein
VEREREQEYFERSRRKFVECMWRNQFRTKMLRRLNFCCEQTHKHQSIRPVERTGAAGVGTRRNEVEERRQRLAVGQPRIGITQLIEKRMCTNLHHHQAASDVAEFKKSNRNRNGACLERFDAISRCVLQQLRHQVQCLRWRPRPKHLISTHPPTHSSSLHFSPPATTPASLSLSLHFMSRRFGSDRFRCTRPENHSSREPIGEMELR